MEKKNTKRSLIFSVMTVLLCVTMLIGTTFAWFTDSVSTGVNKIQSGNLDVALYQVSGTDETKVTENTKLFDEHALWEPGHTQVAYIKVANKGSLALKYKFAINVAEKTIGKTADGRDIDLSDYLRFAVIKDADQYADRAQARAAADAAGTQLISAGFASAEGKLDVNETSGLIAIVVYMPEEVGNEANHNGTDIPSIGLGLQLVATQDTVEEDSFDDQYDKDATLDFTPVSTAAELVEAIAKGETVMLYEDIVLPQQLEVTGDVTIIGNGTALTAPAGGSRVVNCTANDEPVTITLQDVELNGPSAERGISFYDNAEIDLVMENCSVLANAYAINVASANDNVDVIIKNSKVTGWCAYQTWSAGSKVTFDSCTLIGNNDKSYNADGWNNFATVVVNTDAPNSELIFKNCRIEANQTTGNKQYLLSVRTSGVKITLDKCTFYADGAAISDEDLGRYLNIYYEARDLELKIDGEVIPIG